MALLFCDGFDHVDDDYASLLKWDAQESVDNPQYGTGYGRLGGWGLRLYDGIAHYIAKTLPGNYSTLIFGSAFLIEKTNTDSYRFVSFYDSSTINLQFRAMVDGSIAVYRGITLLGSSAPGKVSSLTWFYFETKVVFSNTVGSVEVKINGNQVLNLTGQDTVEGSNEYCNIVRVWSNGSYVYVDDLYVCDTTGTENNDFLGDIKITTLYPTSDGNSSDFTPSTGVDNYATVDEPQLVAATDYNESSTIGHKDLYGVTTYNGTGTIHAVQVNPAVLNTDVGSMNVRALSRSGGTPVDNEGSDFTLSQTIKAASHIWEQEPTDSVAWDASKVNAAEFGIKIQV